MAVDHSVVRRSTKTSCIRRIGNCSLQLEDKRRRFLGHGLPYDVEIDFKITVDEAISRRDNLFPRDLNGSDIDLTIVGDQVTSEQFSRLHLALDDLLLPYPIDLSLTKQIDNPDVLEHIERVGVVLYERPKLRQW